MKWEVRFENKARKELEGIPEDFRMRILATLPALAENPFIGKKMKGKYDGCYSLRVWPYRIIYKVYKDMVLLVIIRIGHRQGVY